MDCEQFIEMLRTGYGITKYYFQVTEHKNNESRLPMALDYHAFDNDEDFENLSLERWSGDCPLISKVRMNQEYEEIKEKYGGIGEFDSMGARCEVAVAWFYRHNARTIWNTIISLYFKRVSNSIDAFTMPIWDPDSVVHIGADGKAYESADTFNFCYSLNVGFEFDVLYNTADSSKKIIQDTLGFLAEQNLIPIIHAYNNEKILVIQLHCMQAEYG